VSFQPRQIVFRQTFAELIERSDTLVLVAERGNASIIGYLLASSQRTFFADGPVAWNEEVRVAAPARGSGVGRLLVEEAEQWAGSIPVAFVTLASRRTGGRLLPEVGLRGFSHLLQEDAEQVRGVRGAPPRGASLDDWG
jgi:GNAT superfamily N-acetyltransferase